MRLACRLHGTFPTVNRVTAVGLRRAYTRIGRVSGMQVMGKQLDVLTAMTAFGVAAYVAIIMDCVACGQLGWSDGRNVRIDVRWTHGEVDRARALAKELVELQPNVILAGTTPATAALQRATRTIPIVFVVVSDPVGAGFVDSLPRPGGNITGFIK